MEMNRKDFFKIAGIATLFGLGGSTVSQLVASGQMENTPDLDQQKSQSGIRWGMVVNMSRCDGNCQNECISACHLSHNVPDHGNKKEEIKWIWKEEFRHVFPDQVHEYSGQEVTEAPTLTLCNHCEHPPCVRVCPTQATFKRESDGIVMMDFHRCIGCRFCMAGCPYGSRSFNFKDPRISLKQINQEFPTRTKGVVEKCNFCAERVTDQLLPHCVEKCPNGVLTFGNLNDPESEIRKILRSQHTMRRKAELGTQPSVFYVV